MKRENCKIAARYSGGGDINIEMVLLVIDGSCGSVIINDSVVSAGLGRGITGGRSLCHADVTAPSWQRDAVHVTTSERDERLQMYAVRAPNELTLITDGLCD